MSSDSKQQKALGKDKGFAYSKNTCKKKRIGSERFTNVNKSCEKSDSSVIDAFLDPLSKIKNLRVRNVNKVIVGNININSLPNKFEQLL